MREGILNAEFQKTIIRCPKFKIFLKLHRGNVGYLIENSSRPGDLVFDPFAGSGTTLVSSPTCQHS